MNIFKLWMKESSSSEKQQLAAHAEVSIQHLYDIAAERRNAGAGLAGRIETAIRAINKQREPFIRVEALPRVGRGDISPACGGCSLYRKEKENE